MLNLQQTLFKLAIRSWTAIGDMFGDEGDSRS
jgi:hypothetical protein